MTMLYGKITGIDKPISRLVQGTIPFNPHASDSGFSLLDDTFALGCTAYDTAVVYGPEREKAFGRWVRERGLREKVVILAKGVHHDSSGPRVTPEGISTDLNNTLAYMEIDYIDLYVLHRDNPAMPVGPIVEALNEHLRAGRIRAFGGSNWTHDRIREANEYASEHSLTPFAVSSPNFSLGSRLKSHGQTASRSVGRRMRPHALTISRRNYHCSHGRALREASFPVACDAKIWLNSSRISISSRSNAMPMRTTLSGWIVCRSSPSRRAKLFRRSLWLLCSHSLSTFSRSLAARMVLSSKRTSMRSISS